MNADLSDPVKFHALLFSNISGTLSNSTDFLGSLETELHHLSQRHQMMSKERKSDWIHFKKGKHSKFLGDCFHCELLGFDGITA